MASSSVFVVAHVYAKPENKDAMFALFEKLVAATREEPGCIKYDLHQDLSDETHFTFIEEWQSTEALQSHFQTSHFKANGAAIKDMIARPVQINQLKKLI